VSRAGHALRYSKRVMDPKKVDPPVARTGGKRAPREVTLHLRVTLEYAAYIDSLAAKEERTRSDMLRILLRRGTEHS
jgi:hypothetical protein